VRYAREKFPRMNIILISGKQVENTPVLTTFPHKPFAPASLVEAVRK
jgi:hypothetical protein